VAFESLEPGRITNKTELVVDNSVMMRWLFDDGSARDRRYAQKVLKQIKDDGLRVLVPYIWVYEATYVVNYYVQEGQIDHEGAMNRLNSLSDLCTVVIDKVPPSILFDFANIHKLSTYDSAYLMLARASICTFATLDKKMLKVARKLGINVALKTQ
jgi:predicted nucleic acid-binding protein